MLPDPTDLRAAATGLVVVAADVRTAAAVLAAVLLGTDWTAPAVDDVRREFGLAQALAEAGCRDLEAGAAHLRRLADVLEQLAQDSARLRRTAAHDLQMQMLLVGPGELADAMARRRADLPPVDDPSWAHRAGAHPVALPPRSPVTVAGVPASPPGVVRADLPQVRGLSGRTRVTVTATYAGCDAATRRTAGLDLARLDPYGLGGSASADWLRRLSDRGSQLAGAGGTWQRAADEATALADLLAGADSGLLLDPRLGLAVQVLAAVRAGDGSVGRLLDGVSAADRAWLALEVPGLPLPAAQHGPALYTKPEGLDWADWGNAAYHLPRDVAEQVARQVEAFRAEALRLRGTFAALSGAARREAAVAALAARRGAARALAGGRRVTRVAGLLPRLKLLHWITTTPVRASGLLRHLPWLNAILLPVTIGMDIHGGMHPVLAVVKCVLSFALTVLAAAVAAAAVTALAGLLGLTAPVWLPVLAAFGFSLLVGYLAAPLLQGGLPRAWHALGRFFSRSPGSADGAGRAPGARPGPAAGSGRLGRGPVPRPPVRPTAGARALAGRRPRSRPGAGERPVTGFSIVPA